MALEECWRKRPPQTCLYLHESVFQFNQGTQSAGEKKATIHLIRLKRSYEWERLIKWMKEEQETIRTHTPQTHTYTHARIKDVLMWHNEDALNINYKRKWPNQSDIRQKCSKIAFSFTSKQKKFLRIVKLKYLLVCSIFHCLIIVAFVIPAIWMIKIYTIYLFYLSNNLQETNGRECRDGGETREREREKRGHIGTQSILLSAVA